MRQWTSNAAPCQQHLLVRSDVGSVMACTCGKLHLKLGYLSLHFDLSGMSALGQLLDEAVQKSGRQRQRAEGDLRLLFGELPVSKDDPELLD